MITLSPLKPGDTIDIIAPAARCNPDVVTQLQQVLSDWGLKSHVPDDLFGPDLLSANSVEKRFQHLDYALSNTTSKAVWCLLGGYGSAKLIPKLSVLKPLKQTKMFIGFSDITALHLFLNQAWGWETIHGPSGRQVATHMISDESIAAIKHLLFGQKYSSPLQHLQPLNQAAGEMGDMTAPIIGGNLSIIQTSLGTPWQIDATNKILFVEEVKERAYRIDRALNHLHQAGVFAAIKGVIFGDFSDCHEPDGSALTDDVIRHFAKNLSVPALTLTGIGHGNVNFPLVFGVPSTLK